MSKFFTGYKDLSSYQFPSQTVVEDPCFSFILTNAHPPSTCPTDQHGGK